MADTIAQTIKRFREERKLSKARLARESGISDAYLVQIEKGDRTPSDAVLVNLARALRIAPHHLFIPAGLYHPDRVARAREVADSWIAHEETESGTTLDDDARDRLLDRAFDYLDREDAIDEHMRREGTDREEEERNFMREEFPLKLSAEEYWGWDKRTAWAPEGWNDLSARDRHLVQQLITRLVQLQSN